jgi:hypothetical protein
MTRHAWAAAALLLVAACSPTSRAVSGGPDSTEVAERRAREQEIAMRLEATRARLDSLKADAAQLGAKADAALTEKIAALQVEKDSAEVKFDRLKQEGRETWDQMKDGFAVMLDSLDVKIDHARHNLHRPS